MKLWIYLIALMAGISLSIEGAVYGELGQTIGKLESSFYNFAAGSIILGLIVLFFGKGKMSAAVEAPRWQMSGGLLGIIYLTILIFAIPVVGVGAAMISVIVGQLLMSLLIESRGWLGSRAVPVPKEKIFAVVLMTISLYLIY